MLRVLRPASATVTVTVFLPAFAPRSDVQLASGMRSSLPSASYATGLGIRRAQGAWRPGNGFSGFQLTLRFKSSSALIPSSRPAAAGRPGAPGPGAGAACCGPSSRSSRQAGPEADCSPGRLQRAGPIARCQTGNDRRAPLVIGSAES
jgi:hypothetical protein